MKLLHRLDVSTWLPAVVVFAVLCGVSITAVTAFQQQGSLLYNNDSIAHINIARRVVDTRSPSLKQFGTVWLPLPHLVMLPFVSNDALWQSGLAGSIPSAVAFVLGGLFLFLAMRRLTGSALVAAASAALFALNPNLLYLQSCGMTESLFYGVLALLFWLLAEFRHRPSLWLAALIGVAAFAGTWTRYDGWFILPFIALALLITGGRHRWGAAILFCALSGIGPLLWLFYNWWYWGNCLEFYNGTYSAMALYRRQLANGMARYPGDGDWTMSAKYFVTALRMNTGIVLAIVGAVGIVAALLRRCWLVLLLLLPPIFYVWSMHSSGTPIFVPGLWPNSCYNVRYGLSVLPLFAAAAPCLAALLPKRFQSAALVLLVAAAVSPWLLHFGTDHWICWQEASRNSRIRRQWTTQAADFLKTRYRTGSGIFSEFGGLTGIYQEAGIPLRETLYDLDEVEWLATHARPDLFLNEEWAVAVSGDSVATTLLRAWRLGPKYNCVKRITVGGGPVIEIYRRSSTYPFYQSARSEERLPADVDAGGTSTGPATDRSKDL